MSDLIEKLKQKVNDVEAARGPAKHILNKRLADLGQVARDHWKEILSALETVRGIEELAAEADLTLNIHPPLIDCHESCEDVRWLVEIDGSGFNGPTLSAAIEAARKQ